MASIIRIKRSSTSGNPSTLGAGELAYSALTDNGSNGGDRLYIGMGTETSGNAVNHVVIGGKYFTDMLDHTPGVLTASSALVVDSSSKLDNLKVDNLDLNGNTISSLDTNGNILLTPNGTGKTVISNLYIGDTSTPLSEYIFDTVGGAVTAGTGITVTNSEGGNTTTISITDTAVTAGSYGGATAIPILTINAQGQITSASTASVASTLNITGDTGSDGIALLSETLGFVGGTGITSSVTANTVTFDIDSTVATLSGTQTLTNKTINLTSNTLVATSAQLAAAVTDETGSGSLVFATSPTLVTPVLGVASATTINKVTITAPATGSTLTIANGKTLTANNTLTFTGTDSSSVAFGSGGTVAYKGTDLSQFASTTSAALAGVISDETGSGSLVFANSPTLITPTLGAALATSITATSGNLTIEAAAGNNNVNILPTGTGIVDVGGKRVGNAADPEQAQDLVTKAYVDAMSNGLDIKASVRAASTTALTATYAEVGGGGGATSFIDGAVAVGVSVYNPALYGSAISTTGSNEGLGYITQTPAASIYRVTYNGTDTEIRFYPGTYDALVITDTTIGDETSISVTIDGITETGTLTSAGGGEFALLSFSGDVFGLVSKNGQNLSLNVSASGEVTYWANGGANTNDFTFFPSGADPWGVYWYTAGGYLEINSAAWANTTAFNNLLLVTSGTTLGVDPAGYGFLVDFTSTSGWTNQGGGIYRMTGTWGAGGPTSFDSGITDISFTYVPSSGGGGGGGVGATLTNSDNQAALTLDSIALASGDRVLIKDQADAKQNGVYVVTTVGSVSTNWVLTRATDFDNSPTTEISPGTFFFVEEGTTQADNGYVITNDGPVVIGTSDIVFNQFSGAGQITAGAGLTKSGNTLNVVGTTDRITVNTDSVDIASTYVGQTTITTLGTIGTGVWQGTVVAGQYGGTGVANTGKTITLGGNLTTSGSYTTTLTATADTSVTLPTSGTLATLAGSEALSNKTITSSSFSGTTIAGSGLITFTNATDAGPLGTAAVVLSGGLSVAKKIYVGTDLIGAGAGTSTLSGFDIDGGTY